MHLTEYEQKLIGGVMPAGAQRHMDTAARAAQASGSSAGIPRTLCLRAPDANNRRIIFQYLREQGLVLPGLTSNSYIRR